ncbi:uncharacterized protein M6B38_344325 [Iris pallida]|uniref:Epoxide hydrolase n=1 Tax=Iris pallida TaxID=29817 RepID=A0AAX6GW51_IRIPA|nr:uncharacterized protein M6B38_344325 [Iris pallida]
MAIRRGHQVFREQIREDWFHQSNQLLPQHGPNWELTEPWTGAQIQVPTKFIVGDRDLVYNYPGVPDYVLKGGFKKHVPLLEPVVVMPGVGHWINQEKPQEITEHIREFIQKF